MKTLYEELTPEKKEKLKNYYEEYPCSYEEIITSLKKYSVVTQLRLGVALSLHDVFFKYEFSFKELYNLFNNEK